MTCKRTIDLLLSLLGLVIAAPVMIIIAACVWLDSPGNVIFAQKRLGLHGKLFDLYKFRKFPAHWRDEGPGVTVARDIRMTRVGAFLERTKLDELPQLWNVLKGDMSFVGPRPESTKFADLFTGRYQPILKHLPGIFGPNQVAFADESRFYPPDEDPENFYRRYLFPRKAEADLEYLRKENCLRDLNWIAQGIGASLLRGLNWRHLIGNYGSVLAIDLFVIEMGWILTNILHFSGFPNGADYQVLVAGLWIFPLAIILGMVWGNCYQFLRPYFALVDMVRLTRAVSVGWLFGSLSLFAYSWHSASWYLVFTAWFVLLPLLLMPRLGFRLWHEKAIALDEGKHPRAVIYGVGVAGIALATWMNQERAGRKLIGFIDDDFKFSGKQILGYRVFGFKRDIPVIHEKYTIDELWVAFNPKTLDRERLQALCRRYGIKLVIVADLEPFSPMTGDNGEARGAGEKKIYGIRG
ncbi:sugar transferase [Nitrosococcus watsonii]|uniref:Sugar transferase n=1 Tax=Nitrosococcus watsoni (strain C-113) TaxID=105559 RepID=D8KBF0_NITWC|nr:sugar transferase [Nitrosococcus watsonii]ADJ29597.1 sugar transferase [Nitrosococcus watsonii C-113]